MFSRRNISFFNELLKSQFVLQVHKKLCRPIHVDCDYCQEMNKYGYEILARYQEVAESSYGHQILRDEVTKKKIALPRLEIVLSIPLIVK